MHTCSANKSRMLSSVVLVLMSTTYFFFILFIFKRFWVFFFVWALLGGMYQTYWYCIWADLKLSTFVAPTNVILGINRCFDEKKKLWVLLSFSGGNTIEEIAKGKPKEIWKLPIYQDCGKICEEQFKVLWYTTQKNSDILVIH
jgi:hypothetical protein